MLQVNHPLKVILHCADTNDSINSKISILDVTQWHKERGFLTVGYHYFIRRNGKIESGRSEKEIGAHVEGHNDNTLGICYEGRNFPSIAQIGSLITLYKKFLAVYKISHNDWYGHCELNPDKSCPGFSMANFRNILRELSPSTSVLSGPMPSNSLLPRT